MKRYQITIDGRSFEVRLLSDPHQDQVEVEVDGQHLVVGVRDLATDAPAPKPAGAPPSLAAATQAAPGGSGAPPVPATQGALPGRSVAAPLPGVVKSIAVQPGQRVDPGDMLLVIEAMKMDNVICASREGVVAAVHVAEGHRVAHGDVMIKYKE